MFVCGQLSLGENIYPNKLHLSKWDNRVRGSHVAKPPTEIGIAFVQPAEEENTADRRVSSTMSHIKIMKGAKLLVIYLLGLFIMWFCFCHLYVVVGLVRAR